MKFLYSVEYYGLGNRHLKTIGIRAENLSTACAAVQRRLKPRATVYAKITSASGTEYAEVQL